jgi:hypothetical protein
MQSTATKKKELAARRNGSEHTSRSVTLNGYERFVLMHQVLPGQGGSFSEILRVKQIRNMLRFTEAQERDMGYSRTSMGYSLKNPEALDQIPPMPFQLDSKDIQIIALGFKHMEQEKRLPTADAFVELYQKFEADVEGVEV